jgi:pimeloyl-ACP methyl ester carboxylesterase
MNLILLPGNSAQNREWIENIERALKPKFSHTHTQYYDHWQQGGGFKLKSEREKLVTTANKFGKFAIFAKSVGVFLTLNATQQKLISPAYCIFCGTTRRSAELLPDWHTPTLFIQEEEDPFLHYSELAETVYQIGDTNHQLLVIPGTKHWYDKISKVKPELDTFIQSH